MGIIPTRPEGAEAFKISDNFQKLLPFQGEYGGNENL